VSKYLADWALGDSIKDLQLDFVKSDGTAFDLTSATVTLQGKRDKDVAAAISVAGVVGTPATNGIVTFSDITAGLALGTADRQVFECRGKVVKSGKTGWSDPFQIGVVKWP
jgi:hypothetical protein